VIDCVLEQSTGLVLVDYHVSGTTLGFIALGQVASCHEDDGSSVFTEWC